MSLVYQEYLTAKGVFQDRADLDRAQRLMSWGSAAWAQGSVGDATFVRDVLEPVRSYLLAGNTPMRDGKPEVSE